LVALLLLLGLLSPPLMVAGESLPADGHPQRPTEAQASPTPTDVPAAQPSVPSPTVIPATELAGQGGAETNQTPQRNLAVQSEASGSITVHGYCTGAYGFNVTADEPYTGTVSATYNGQTTRVGSSEGPSGSTAFTPPIGIFLFQWQLDSLTTSITYTVVANLQGGGQIIGETTIPNCSPTVTPTPTSEPTMNIDQLIQLIIQILTQILGQMG
jgi:hypothetical protein